MPQPTDSLSLSDSRAPPPPPPLNLFAHSAYSGQVGTPAYLTLTPTSSHLRPHARSTLRGPPFPSKARASDVSRLLSKPFAHAPPLLIHLHLSSPLLNPHQPSPPLISPHHPVKPLLTDPHPSLPLPTPPHPSSTLLTPPHPSSTSPTPLHSSPPLLTRDAGGHSGVHANLAHKRPTPPRDPQ